MRAHLNLICITKQIASPSSSLSVLHAATASYFRSLIYYFIVALFPLQPVYNVKSLCKAAGTC